MKNLKYIWFILFTIIMTDNLLTQTQDDMNKLSWIVDRWISKEGASTSYEHWEKTSDVLFTGGSETVKNGDTVFAEKLKIEVIDGSIYYIADVSHNPEPVKFKLTYVTETEAVFENPQHDFPKKITYMLVEGKLHASIEGPSKKIDFVMNKMR